LQQFKYVITEARTCLSDDVDWTGAHAGAHFANYEVLLHLEDGRLALVCAGRWIEYRSGPKTTASGGLLLRGCID